MSNREYRCPYCLEHHGSVRKCSKTNQSIPAEYIRALEGGMPTLHMLFIGYSGHGKTCYLAGLLHQFFHGPAVERWPGFYPLGLTQETLDHIHRDYVAVLDNMQLPPSTLELLPRALILHLDSVPRRAVRGVPLPVYRQADLMITMHDIGGEAYKTQQDIADRLPLIAGVKHLVVLIDLTRLREDASRGHESVVQQLHRLMSTVHNALQEVGDGKRKGVVVCFTKADRMWGHKDYGALAERLAMSFPGVDEMGSYSRVLDERSEAIAAFVQQMYPAFYNMLKSVCKPVRFASVSSLGHEPVVEESGTQHMAAFSPANVFDPLFWYMKMEGLM